VAPDDQQLVAAAEGGADGGHVGEPGPLGLGDQVLALLPGEGVVLEPAARPGEPLGDQQATGRPEDAAQLGQAGVRVGPVVEGGDRPGDRGLAAAQREALGDAVGHADGVPQRRRGPPGRQPAHLRRRVDPDRRRPPLRRLPQEPPRPAPHVHHPVPRPHLRQVGDEPGAPPSPERHRQPAEQPQEPLELVPVAAAVAHMPPLMVHALLLVIRCHRCHTPSPPAHTELTRGQYYND